MYKGKVFMNGQSQAVRLPKNLRFNTNQVSIIPLGNGLVLQPLLRTWEEVFDKIEPTNDFFTDGRKDSYPQERKWELFK